MKYAFAPLILIGALASPADAQLFGSTEKREFVDSCKLANPSSDARCPCMFEVLNKTMTPDQIQFFVAMNTKNERKAMLLVEKHGRDWAAQVQPTVMSLAPEINKQCGK